MLKKITACLAALMLALSLIPAAPANASAGTGGRAPVQAAASDAVTYKVSYSAEGATGVPKDGTKKAGTDYTLNSSKPSKKVTVTFDPDGGKLSTKTKTYSMTFREWYTNAALTGTSYVPGGRYQIDADVTFYAAWDPAKLSGLPKPTKSGFEFGGWVFKSGDNEGKAAENGTELNADAELIAKWNDPNEGSYTISFNADGGSPVPEAITKKPGVNKKLSVNDPKKSVSVRYNVNGGKMSGNNPANISLTFLGWDTNNEKEENEEDEVIFRKGGNLDDRADSAAKANGGNLTLYAVWKRAVLPTLPTPSKTGYGFGGWYYDQDYKEKADSGDRIMDDSVELYAQWLDIYKISFNANGGTNAPGTVNKTEGKELKLSGSIPNGAAFKLTEVLGYSNKTNVENISVEFKEWNNSADGSGRLTAAKDAKLGDDADALAEQNNGRLTLYAQWSDTAKASQPNVSREGYSIDGWYSDKELSKPVTFPLEMTEDMTIYAKWKEDTIVVPPSDDDPTQPTSAPTQPTQPTSPTDAQPTSPTDAQPTSPTDAAPTTPTQPTEPTQPTQPSEAPAKDRVKRLGGTDRYSTAGMISAEGWDKADTVIIAAGGNYPDALAGAVLANKLGAPILLADGDKLSESTLAEIKRLGAGSAYILGGTAAVGSGVDSQLSGAGVKATRVAGGTRYETAAKIAALVTGASTSTASDGAAAAVALVSAESYADALSVSSAAAIEGIPVLFVAADGTVPEATSDAISASGAKKAYIIGGTSAVGTKTESALSGMGLTVERIGGSDRYDTSVKVYDAFKASFTSSDACVATGRNFPDALAGAAFAARSGMNVFLIGDSTTPALAERIKDAQTLYILGGSSAVPDSAVI